MFKKADWPSCWSIWFDVYKSWLAQLPKYLIWCLLKLCGTAADKFDQMFTKADWYSELHTFDQMFTKADWYSEWHTVGQMFTKADWDSEWHTFGQMLTKADWYSEWHTFGHMFAKADCYSEWHTFSQMFTNADWYSKWPTFGQMFTKADWYSERHTFGKMFTKADWPSHPHELTGVTGHWLLVTSGRTYIAHMCTSEIYASKHLSHYNFLIHVFLIIELGWMSPLERA